MKQVAIVGGGPAGLRAAEILAESRHCMVTLFESQPSVGRKLLVAGKGGLNLTHSEEIDSFAARYAGENWPERLSRFGPEDLRKWVATLCVETYVGSSGRVFPVGQQSARLLRRWVVRLRSLGVQFRVRHLLEGIESSGRLLIGGKWEVFDAVLLALGGASWPQTGSTGLWPDLLRAHDITISPWQPANCGWETIWPAEFADRFAGVPLKNLRVTAGSHSVRGELLITQHGLEGGALYQLGPVLRTMESPQIVIDFNADTTKPIPMVRLAPAVRWLLENGAETSSVHSFPIALTKARPTAEAISSAGGVSWSELDESLQIRRLPGVWVAGEMIDWEAPTGGYLLQGCFTTGTIAAEGILKYLGQA